MPQILIVEDDRELAQMIASFLEFEGHVAWQAYDGSTALEIALSKPLDLVILDWDLPDLSGIDILTQYRENNLTAPVIMLTGRSDPKEKETGLDSGADDYVTKPFKMTELGARVRAQLRRQARLTSHTFTLGKVIVDKEKMTASLHGLAYVLSGIQFKLLELAAKHQALELDENAVLSFLAQEKLQISKEKLKDELQDLRQKIDAEGALVFPHLYLEPKQTLDAAAPDTEDSQLLGTILDNKYILQDTLGGGGSSLVFRASHRNLGNTVAVKILVADAYLQPDAKARFMREAAINGNLSHPHIIEVRDFGIAERGQPYLVMEYLDGKTLNDWLESRPTPPFQALLLVFKQICQALSHAHKAGIVHRDVKPSNIMVMKQEKYDSNEHMVRAKLLDFGLARPLIVNDNRITMTGHVIGSAPYMSPEQCRGETVDERADIYSLGCTFYEAVHGDMPYPDYDAVSIMMRHLQDPPPKIGLISQPPAVNQYLTEILERCLAKDKKERFQSAAALELAFDKAIEMTGY